MTFIARFNKSGVTTLTDAATIAVDISLGPDFKVTLGGNRTLGNPTNSATLTEISITVAQDSTGGRTLIFSSDWIAVDPTITIASSPNAVSLITAKARDFGSGTKWYYEVTHAAESSGPLQISDSLQAGVNLSPRRLWPLDVITGVLVDKSSNASNLTQTGSVTNYITGPVLGTIAPSFSAAVPYYTNDTGNVMLGEATVIIAVRPTSSGTYWILSGGGIGGTASSVDNINWALRLVSNDIVFLSESGTRAASTVSSTYTGAIQTGVWNIIAFSRDAAGTGIKLFLNGIQVASGTVTAPTTTGTTCSIITGVKPGGTEQYAGSMCGLHIFDYQLADSDIYKISKAMLKQNAEGGEVGKNIYNFGANNVNITTTLTEVIIGGLHLDPTIFNNMTVSLRLVGNFSTTDTLGSFQVRLYDMGDGTGAFTPVKLSTVSIPYADRDKQIKVDKLLALTSSPTADSDRIHNTARVYELRAYLNVSSGSPTAYVAEAGIVAEAGTVGAITLRPTQLTANQTDWNPTGLSPAVNTVYVNSDSAINIYSLVSTGFEDGSIVYLINNGSFNITIKYDDGATGTASYRFITPSETDYVMDPNATATLIRDTTSARWRLLS